MPMLQRDPALVQLGEVLFHTLHEKACQEAVDRIKAGTHAQCQWVRVKEDGAAVRGLVWIRNTNATCWVEPGD